MDSCTVHVTNITTPTLLSLVRATRHRRRGSWLTWYSGVGSEEPTLLRQEAGSSWRRIATLRRRRRTHRLPSIARFDRERVTVTGSPTRLARWRPEVWIDRSGAAAPGAPPGVVRVATTVARRFASERRRAARASTSSISSGRRVLSMRSPPPIERRRLSLSCDPPSGIYFANLVQGSRSARGKVRCWTEPRRGTRAGSPDAGPVRARRVGHRGRCRVRSRHVEKAPPVSSRAPLGDARL